MDGPSATLGPQPKTYLQYSTEADGVGQKCHQNHLLKRGTEGNYSHYHSLLPSEGSWKAVSISPKMYANCMQIKKAVRAFELVTA